MSSRPTRTNFILALVAGFLLMAPVSSLFDANNWPVFHTWGLVHGSWLVAWPALTALSFPFIVLIRHRLGGVLRR